MASPPQLTRVYRSIIIGASIAVILLISQNLLGMYMNFWVDLSVFGNIGSAFRSEGVLDAHVAVGLVIVVGTFLQALLDFRSKNTALRLPGLSAFAFSLLALFSGIEFTFGGGSDIFSFTMELGFVGIFASIATILYIAGRSRGRQSSSGPDSAQTP